MKKLLKMFAAFIFAAFIIGNLSSCRQPSSGSGLEQPTNKASAYISGFYVISDGRYFSGKVNDSSITIDLPSNIDSWSNVVVKVRALGYRSTVQFNGTGTKYDITDRDDTPEISGIELLTLKTILIEGSGRTPKTYNVTINKRLCLFVDYNGVYVNNSSELRFERALYKAGEKILLPAKEAKSSEKRQFGWSTVKTDEEPLYNIGGEIPVTQAMVDAGTFKLYMIWSKYGIGDKITNVNDIDGKPQTGYVAYILGKTDSPDSVKTSSSKPAGDWNYLVVSQYGAQRLTNVAWQNAKTGLSNTYLPSKAEMEVIIKNLWENYGTRQWKVFSDGNSTASSWDYYWTATEDDGNNAKAYCGSVTPNNYNGAYAGLIEMKAKTAQLKAIGVSYIK